MILYLDASALVKRYIAEFESQRVNDWIAEAEALATALFSRVEVIAAVTRAIHMRLIGESDAMEAIKLFRSEWENYQRIPINEIVVARGDVLACEYYLRGSDAVHLACAIIWQEELGLPVTMGTFDRQLSEAGKKAGIEVIPVVFGK